MSSAPADRAASSSAQSSSAPKPGLTKGRAVMLLVLFSAATLLATTQTWVNVSLPDTGVTREDLTVRGSDASRAVIALSIVALAASLAGAAAGRVARTVTLVIATLALAGASVFSFAVFVDPSQAASGKIAEAIGISNHNGVAESLATAWPVIAGVVSGVGALVAAALVWLSRTWSVTGKYQHNGIGTDTAAARGSSQESSTKQAQSIDAWDDLSRGDDPTA